MDEKKQEEKYTPKHPLYLELYTSYGQIPAGLYEWSKAKSTYSELVGLYERYKKDGMLIKYPDGSEGNATVRAYFEEVNK